ncbi:hypothetical protein [Pontibacter anaerobius]|uniref:Uncharacterized protein n=1 Tax=Pontibacter anaerobius TaxID=2993940 RepID=A0ABT3RGP8_9BACT|nr:hypothetical protein [Pontibacter anaerobius]MCX2740563.1 hypothetical protein [Pontibacter anaerobius]
MKKSYLAIAALLVFILFNIWNHYRVKQRGEQDSEIFYTSGINGKITYLSANVGAVYFKVGNSEAKYMFIPTSVSGKGEERFSAFATKGDSISKPANATVLKLYKDDKVYKYKFKKLHEQPHQNKKVKPKER